MKTDKAEKTKAEKTKAEKTNTEKPKVEKPRKVKDGKAAFVPVTAEEKAHAVVADRQQKEFKKARKKVKPPQYVTMNDLFKGGHFSPDARFQDIINFSRAQVFMSLGKNELDTAIYQIITWTLGYVRAQRKEARRTIAIDLAAIKARVEPTYNGSDKDAQKEFQLHACKDVLDLIREVERLVNS